MDKHLRYINVKNIIIFKSDQTKEEFNKYLAELAVSKNNFAVYGILDRKVYKFNFDSCAVEYIFRENKLNDDILNKLDKIN